ncbi:hypothetical protein ACFFX0_03210 [Citricoccus parietis]|uniref:Uncharacterized protein n=1 Tax=Citricoccus parietis TaxID=592307 RepID=A0ABV5FU91_9MICC
MVPQPRCTQAPAKVDEHSSHHGGGTAKRGREVMSSGKPREPAGVFGCTLDHWIEVVHQWTGAYFAMESSGRKPFLASWICS